MRRAYICSPLGGNVSVNIENAKRYARYVFKCGMAPVIPHFYALVLDDNKDNERKLGMQAGISLLWVCDEVWVFGNEITEGMKKEIRGQFCRCESGEFWSIKSSLYDSLCLLRN